MTGTAVVDSGDNGPATSAQIVATSMALDAAGNLYLANGIYDIVRRINLGASSGSAPVLSFLPTQIGSSSTSQNLFFQVNSAVTISSIAVPASVNGAPEYTVGTISGCTVGAVNPAGSVCQVPITFAPAFAGVRQVPLLVTTSTGITSFGLTGQGIGPQAVFSPGSISTVAGNGVGAGNGGGGYTGDNVPATSTELYIPYGEAVDVSGNLYIADRLNNRVRKVTPSGTITTVVGTGVAGYSGDNGPATQALIQQPDSLAIDSAGNLYVADSVHANIRRIDANGIITTIAGNGTYGYSGDGGPAVNAVLNDPEGLAFDVFGNLYIADPSNQSIRKINTSGIISTVAGNRNSTGFGGDGGPAVSASFWQPTGVAADALGNIYIADQGDNRIRKVDTGGIVTTVAGNGSYGASGDNGLAVNASIYYPRAVAVDAAGDLYITDSRANLIRKVDAAGIITTLAGDARTGYAGAVLNYPVALSLDAAGNLYIADTINNLVRKISANALQLTYPTKTIVGAKDSTDGAFKMTVSNIGTSTLNFATPTTGYNASISSGFTYDAASTCSQVSSSSQPYSLTSGADCIYAVDFAPTGAGAVNGSLVLSSNSLNGSSATTASLSGTGYYVPPVGSIDSAVDASTYSGTVAQTDSLLVAGWVADAKDGAPLSNVKVYIDGVYAGTPILGITRLDVATGFGNAAYLHSGYRFSFPASGLTVGSHAVTVVAGNSNGASVTLGPASFTIAAGSADTLFGSIDQAVDAGTFSPVVSQSDSLLVTGWAVDAKNGAPVATAKVYIDGNFVGAPSLGFARRDISTVFGNASYANSGYRFTYPASGLAAGSHSVTVTLANGSGNSTILGPAVFSVTAAASANTLYGAVDQAVDAQTSNSTVFQTDSLIVSGWVFDVRAGAPVASVQVYVDGAYFGAATTGLARPDVAAIYANAAYTNSGYSFTAPVASLSAGSHSITVKASNASGVTVTLTALPIFVIAAPTGQP